MTSFTTLSSATNTLQAQSSRISSISQNIANVNTVGYRQANPVFEQLIMGDQSVTLHSYSGSKVVQRQAVSRQGQIEQTYSPTDLAISGNGFFAVRADASNPSDVYYTRAGAFAPDADGNFVNTAGYYLQGWRVDSTGDLPNALNVDSVGAGAGINALTTVNVHRISGEAVPTRTVYFQAVLKASQAIYTAPYDATDPVRNMATGAVVPQFSYTQNVVDSNGREQMLDIGFLKTGINTWAVEIYGKPGASVAGTNPQVAAGTLTFNGDGTLASISPTIAQNVNINWQSGGTSNIAFDWGTAGPPFGTPGAVVIGRGNGISQVDSGYKITQIQQDGHVAGSLESVSVDAEGYVIANYGNGTTQKMYKIPLAGFVDPNLLETKTGDIFYETKQTGSPFFGQADSGYFGKIRSSSLEQSNVEISEQFTDIIVAQRAYQANTRLITTSDDMLEALTRVLG